VNPGAASRPGGGRLLLVPTPLADVESTPLPQVLPLGTLQAAASLEHWIVENAKTARAFLGAVHAVCPLRVPLQQHRLAVLPKHERLDASAARALLEPALAGHDIGLVSEAGAPCVADPGALVVARAHELGLGVLPLVGPSSVLLALMASGLDGQCFAFHGYLPVDEQARRTRLQALERESAQRRQTQLFIETPYRNAALLRALAHGLRADTRVSVACELTAPQGFVRTRTAAQWRDELSLLPPRVPAMFALLAG
jgi:16S rRNA (cytidine1402-2'-O)-methyltransferase